METYSKLAFLLCYKSLSPAISQKSCKLVFFDAIELALKKNSKISFFISFFLFFIYFWLGLTTSCKVEQPLQGMQLNEKKKKRIKRFRKAIQKEPKEKICLLTLELKSFRSYVKRKYSAGKEFQIPDSSCVKKETDILIISRNGDGKIMQPIRIRIRPAIRMRDWNQYSLLRWKSTKVIPKVKTKAGYIWTLSQRVKG